MSNEQKTAVVIGAGRGSGRAIALALGHQFGRVVAVARNKADLDALKADMPGAETVIADATQDGVAAGLIRDHDPDLIVLAAGLAPRMGQLTDFDWDAFSAPWQSDTKMAFLLAKAALETPLKAGGAVIAFSSGAAIEGSRLSGGYAGAKRMQHYIMNYAQSEANQQNLGHTYTTLYPQQLIAGTEIGANAARAYADAEGLKVEAFMARWEKPLTPDVIAGQVAEMAQSPQPGAFGLKGTGMSPLG